MKFTCEMSLAEAAELRPCASQFGLSPRGWDALEEHLGYGQPFDLAEIDNWGINEYSERTLTDFMKEHGLTWEDVPASEYTPVETLLYGLTDCGKVIDYWHEEGGRCWLLINNRASADEVHAAMRCYALK